MTIRFVNPLPGIRYEQAWGPWAGTHHHGQNWQSGSAWDLLVPKGLPVVSPIDGVVVSVGQGTPGTRFAGAKVGIQGDACSVFLTHLSAASVAKGQRVTAGQRVGTTGEANGVEHLHIGMGGPNYFNGADSNGIDPAPYLKASARYLAPRGPHGYPLYQGLAAQAPPAPKPKPKESFADRFARGLRTAGFGARSIADALKRVRPSKEA